MAPEKAGFTDKMMRDIQDCTSGRLLLCLFLLLLLQQQQQQRVDAQDGVPRLAFWSRVFTSEVLAEGALASASSATLLSCSVLCASRPGCLSFGLSGTACWLYGRYVEYQTNGTAGPDTNYYWRLSPRCPTELGYNATSGICYKILSVYGNWEVGRDACASEGGVLYQGNTPDRVSALVHIGEEDLWLGASDSHVEGDWRWLSGQEVTSNWERGQPDDYGNADYMFLRHGFVFDDSYLDGYMAPLCEIPLRL